MEKGVEKKIINQLNIPEGYEAFFAKMEKFRDIMLMYNCAIKEIQTKFEILNDELSVRKNRNPIEFIKSRIKKPQSIYEKLGRKNLELSEEAITEHLNDIAGVRVVCSFVDDIYEVAGMLARQDDITVISVKDYIKTPKPNGYRSYHMIVSVPVFFSDRSYPVKVEVQLRTIAMDFWASLEHKMKYKKDVENASEISRRLKECAEVISKTDLAMQGIHDDIENI